MTGQPRANLVSPATPVQFLRGVGQARAALLNAAGLLNAGDLLNFFPFRYEDRRRLATIAQLPGINQPVTVRGRVVSAGKKTSPVKRLAIFEAILDDGTGTIMAVWFNQPYLADKIRRNDQLLVYGQPRINSYGRFQLENPDFEKIETTGEGDDDGAIVPVYSAVSGIPPRAMRRIVASALDAIAAVEDPLPPAVRARLGVIDLSTALVQLHHPQELSPDFMAAESPAHRRIILQEFFEFQLALRLRRTADDTGVKGRSIVIDDALRDHVRNVLPFTLTGAQKRVLREIAGDLQNEKTMYRLLQGDVGSGKTIVALVAAVIVIDNGHQAAILAPTEVLAEQHYQRISQLLDKSGIRLAKLTGNSTAAERRTILRALREGFIDLLVGTHAVLEDEVRFKSLGLAIVDEQHRFGVVQRQKLFAKGDYPDILVMTATPIPRSLALAMFGDLELSVIDELPPGRMPVKTVVRGNGRLAKVYDFLDEKIAGGEQVFVVFPLIEESEKLDLKPLTVGFEEISRRFQGRRVAMLHGRMAPSDKQETMRRFSDGEIDILVATTVIEVGIDVPNASLMVIIGADRFGLSQLHQLRGRVGRGANRSFCILIRDERANEEAKQRLRTFEQTRDGFEVAERDLELRGAGDFLGT
ncbi:MAG: ATP-dependent DNA helicase RecG, partial [Acidobacteriota bacterium]